MAWHLAVKISDLAKDSGKSLEIEGRKVALFHADGKYYALEDSCIHRGGPLGGGHLEGMTVICPWHAWSFDVKTGECHTTPGAKQKTYPTKTENGNIYVNLGNRGTMSP